MTVIVYRDGIMAADGLGISGTTIVATKERKIIRSAGSLIGLAGDVAATRRFMDQVKRSPNAEPPYNLLSMGSDGSSWVLIIRPTGRIELMNSSGHEILGNYILDSIG